VSRCSLRRQLDISQELHFDCDRAVALAGVAAPSGHIEGKMSRRKRKSLGLGLRAKELADQIEALIYVMGLERGVRPIGVWSTSITSLIRSTPVSDL